MVKRKRTPAEKRVSYASVLLHTLYWALQEIGATQERNSWFVPIKYASRLLGKPHIIDLKTLETEGLDRFIQLCDWLKSDDYKRRDKKNYPEITEPRIARAPHLYMKRTPGVDVVQLSSTAILCTTNTGLGGINHGRSAYTVLSERASNLLGCPSDKMIQRRDRNRLEVLAEAKRVIEKFNLPAQKEVPDYLKKDPSFQRTCQNIRWMNPEDRTCQR